ncbi:MAG: NAD(+) synthase, partial [Myxococcaceae bacterium]
MLLDALCLGLRDYVNKSSAKGVLIGLSGGIDSAVVAVLAVRALGPERVIGVRMPSKYSSQHSLDDAEALAQNLGVALKTIQIESLVESFREVLDLKQDLSDQNLQARVRAVILMALSNETGFFVLATSNKSEIAMGYG